MVSVLLAVDVVLQECQKQISPFDRTGSFGKNRAKKCVADSFCPDFSNLALNLVLRMDPDPCCSILGQEGWLAA
jgi:hypothetical protein